MTVMKHNYEDQRVAVNDVEYNLRNGEGRFKEGLIYTSHGMITFVSDRIDRITAYTHLRTIKNGSFIVRRFNEQLSITTMLVEAAKFAAEVYSQ